MGLEELLDPRRAHPALEPPDDALVLHQHKRWHGRDAEALRQLPLLVNVHQPHLQPRPLLPLEVREQTFHPSGRPGAHGAEEDEERTGVDGHRRLFFPCKRGSETRLGERVYTHADMWEAYRIGLSLGLGI